MRLYHLRSATLFTGLLLFVAACKQPMQPQAPPHATELTRLSILYTNDEHGWMEASSSQDGAAAMMALWQAREGVDSDENFLILSGGDNWSGPAISTWFKGESMTAVMNVMDYDASAIGNHEFDFQVSGLKERIEEARFPYLAANIIEKKTGQIPDFISPYIVEDVRGVRVGIIGLASMGTPLTTFPTYVTDYSFLDYQQALRTWAPRVREENVDVVIVLSHLTGSEMRALAPFARSQRISLILGGHSHETVNESLAGVTLVQASSYMRKYSRIDLSVDTLSDSVHAVDVALVENRGDARVPAVEAVVETWRARTDEALSEVIGYAGGAINRYNPALANLITDSWLEAMPQADVALTNRGGIRQGIPEGEISLATIVGVLPFNNSIYQLELNGQQLVACAAHLEMAGLSNVNGWKLVDGTVPHADSTYVVLTTDYLYSRDDNDFARFDETPYDTGVHFRQPVIDWIRALQTTAAQPLNGHLDVLSRH